MDEKNERWLNEWYCKCRNKYIDLGNFGGGELFVIEGDSLLFKFLYDPETDFIDFSQPFGGGQFLALAFLVENFLKKLKEREFAFFHIVFFDVHESIWNNRPKLRLAREIIINHLKSRDTKVPIFTFNNWWDENWKDYLDDKQPLFILTGDGSTENLKIKASKDYVDKEIDVSSIYGIATKNSLRLTIILRAFIFYSLHMDMPVALLSGMEFRDSHVYSFVFERSFNVDLKTKKKLIDIKDFTIKVLKKYDEKSLWLNDSVEDFNLISSIKDLLISQECLDVWSKGGKRIALILLSLTGVLINNNDKSDFHYLAKIFLLHIILLDYLPLKLRVIPPVDEENTKAKDRVELFLQILYSYCAKIYISDILHEATKNFQDLNNNLYDLLDARLFVSLIQFQCDGHLNFNSFLTTDIKNQFDDYWNLLKRLCECNGLNSLNVDDENFNKEFEIKSYEKSYLEYVKKPSLLPFEHEFFTDCLEDMNINLNENSKIKIDEPRYGLIEEVDYDESTYNFSLKLSKSNKAVEKSSAYYEKHKNSMERRAYQQYVRFLENYAASLNGTQGYYRQKIIVERSTRRETLKASKASSKASSKPVTKQTKSTKKESTGVKKAREKIEQETLKSSRITSDQYLDDALKEILKDGNIRNQLNALNVKLEKTDKIKHPFTMLRGQFKKLELFMKLWIDNCMNSQAKKDFTILVDILHQVFYIAQNFPTYFDPKLKDILVKVLRRLKLKNCKDRMKGFPTTTTNEKPFKLDFPGDWVDLSAGMSDARFQMLYAGHLMDRNTNSVDDSRVPHFRPDSWQVDVLDVIDKDESALICCPTSSGKTFISFYAMEKVLKESDDGILVYVSPTKALVNQVTAEVYGRFEKSYDHGDKSTWGIYTREYRENHEKCQILITIPQMLETLLFSPRRASWARNVKRIILDEIHMIGSEGGEFYDRLLLLSKSIPILALSATVGNPEPFNEWMARSRQRRGQRMRLIKSTKRFSDLQQYVYLPQFPLPSLLETTINPKENMRQNSSIVPINPIFSLSMSILKEYGFPGDMKLVPSQCVQLWDVMKKYAGENPPHGLDELDPDVYFKDIGYIVKDDADEYEQKLKEVFKIYAKDDSLSDIIESTIEELGNDIKNGFSKLESTANTTQCVQLWDVMKEHVGDNPPDGFGKLNPDVYFKNIKNIVRDDVDDYEKKLGRVFIKCFQLWDALKESVGDNPPNGLDKLEPNVYFKDFERIFRKDVDEYEQKLKEVFKNQALESAIGELITCIKSENVDKDKRKQLWKVLKESTSVNPPNGLDELNPDKFFKDIGNANDINEYEQKLKEVFKNQVIETTIGELITCINSENVDKDKQKQLWDVMKKQAGDEPPNGFDELNPDKITEINNIDEYEQKLRGIFKNKVMELAIGKLISFIKSKDVDKDKQKQLWDLMKDHADDNSTKGLDELNPSIYFKNIKDINNIDEYEQKLREIFKNQVIDSAIGRLITYIKNGLTKLESTSNELTNELDVYGDKFLEKGIVPLLCELSAQGKLPAILFHFDEKGCVELAMNIVNQLELAEKEKRENDPDYQARKKAAMSQKETYEKDLKRRRDKKSTSAPPEDDIPLEEPIPTFFDWEAHDPNFTFVDQKGRTTTEEFEEIVEPLRYKVNDNLKLLIAALERGIGVHHTDLPRKYLSAVEILFRRRYLRVIIATGTLALGINMPCKTTVFVGDSISLTALQYRQMSGRSGRRGFDPLGHVVFFGITLTKIIRLLMSRLPNLSRHFPLSTSLTLRSFNFINKCKTINDDDYDYAINTIKGFFGESFFFLGKEYLPERIKYHLRFSVEYLRRESLLGPNGNLINLSAMVSHLNYNEPSNFAFAVLFKHGVFHRICSKSKTNEKLMNDLILILSHLFNRIKLRKISEDWYKNTESLSKIVLSPLPKKVNNILEEHNERVLDIYTDYVVTFARNNAAKMGPDNTLPLSSIKIPPKYVDQKLLDKDPLISKLKSTAISFIARSPFIAMGGSLGDIFNNLEDLAHHLHSEIYLDLHSIPFIKTDEILNAYISDFFSHGQEKAIVEANGIRRGEVWQVLNEFFGVLSSIVISLRERNFSDGLEEREEEVLRGFEMVLQHFWEKFVQTWV